MWLLCLITLQAAYFVTNITTTEEPNRIIVRALK